MDKYPGAANFQNVKILQVIIIPRLLSYLPYLTFFLCIAEQHLPSLLLSRNFIKER